VRHSMVDPYIYVQTNVMGHLVMLELARTMKSLKHFVYASSSSVYGSNRSLPFNVGDRVDHPISLYAATKRADELMSETYAHLHNLNVTGLRYFTVYGPWGRPDMSPWIFAKAIYDGATIQWKWFEALDAPECPLPPADRERAKRNVAGKIIRALLLDVRRRQWHLALFRIRHARLSWRDWLRYASRPSALPDAGSPRMPNGDIVIPAALRRPPAVEKL